MAPSDHRYGGARAWLPGERDDIARVLRGLDMFVLPSLGEGVSNTVLEAMASGTPTIVANRASLPEIAGDAALQVDPDDPDGLADSLRRALTDPTTPADRRSAAASVLRRLAEYLEREYELRLEIKRKTLYPKLLLAAFLFIPDLTDNATGWVLVVLIVLVSGLRRRRRSERPRPTLAGSDRDATVAAAEVDQIILGGHGGEIEHMFDQRVRSRHERHVQFPAAL